MSSTAGSRYNGAVEFILRDSRPGDFETLWAIDQACFPSGIAYSRVELKFYIRRRNSFTLVAENVAEEEGLGQEKSPRSPVPTTRIAGFIVGEAVRGQGHIITIDVIAEARRSGLGSELLTAAEDRLRSAACASIHLETAVDNKAAIAFYKRHKYFIEKTAPRYYSNGVDALVLAKPL